MQTALEFAPTFNASEVTSPVQYFAYTASIDPNRLDDVAPGAQFAFIAHLPEWRLVFPYKNGQWDGALPSARPEPGNTVWGAVFELSKSELKALDSIEAAEGRALTEVEIMDRHGRRHAVVTHLASENGATRAKPSADYLRLMLQGGRHWQLPAGWIAGLEEHLQRA